MGVATTRQDERALVAKGLQQLPEPRFESVECIANGGVLTLIPFLISQGLMSYQNHYQAFSNGYYRLESILITLCYIYLCRIKSIEQLKNHKPGELGKLMGLDRVPEAKCMRLNVKAVSDQEKAHSWNEELTQKWLGNQEEEETIFYIDGHVYVYSGYQANMGKKHVARQKLCMAGMNEFWVHDQSQMPIMVVSGHVNEKLIEVIDKQILPKLNEHVNNATCESDVSAGDENQPHFTLIFDREGYSPEFFARLWKDYHIAVITYKKFAKENWDDTHFEQLQTTDQNGKQETIEMAESQYESHGIKIREIRKKGKHDHQTAMLTTHPLLDKLTASKYLFNRWIQENFFKYGRQDYAIDKIAEYSVDELDGNIKVVNPEYNKAHYRVKKKREKISRQRARLHKLIEENADSDLDKNADYEQRLAKEEAELKALQEQEKALVGERQKHCYKIALKDMPAQSRYNTVNRESKHFQNILKMICYRAETAMVNLLRPHYKKSANEGHMLVKEIINTSADLVPDEANKTLQVNLYGLSTPRANNALQAIITDLNETHTTFPGTDMRLQFSLGTN